MSGAAEVPGMSSRTKRIFPWRGRDGDATPLLEFAWRATSLLAPAFAPARTVHGESARQQPYAFTEVRRRIGEEAAGLEVLAREDECEMGAFTLSSDTVNVTAYGLPAGTSFSIETVRRPNHPLYLRSVEVVVDGDPVTASAVTDAFERDFGNCPLEAEELDMLLQLAERDLRPSVWDNAIEEAQVFLRYRPGNAGARFVLGVAHGAKGELDKAREHLEAAVAADPGHGDAWYNLALVHLEQGGMDTAMTCLRRALEISPGNHSVLYRLGVALEKQGRADEARSMYAAAVAQDPNPGGWGYGGMDFTDEARAALERLSAR